MNRQFAILFFLILMWLSATAAGQARNFFIDGAYLTGSAIRNYPDFPELKGPANLVSLRFAKHFNGYKSWHNSYRKPWFGVQLVGGSLGNNNVLGKMVGAMAQLNFTGKIAPKWHYTPTLSIGASWFSEPYDETTNPQNFIIGSPVTFLAAASVELNYQLNEKYAAYLTGGLMHASNSHFQLPNVGLNIPLAGLGVRYYFKAGKDTTGTDSMFPVADTLHKWAVNARIALGVNEQGDAKGPVNGPKYLIYLGSVYGSYKASPVNKITGGIECWYNTGVYDYIVSQEFYDDNEKAKSMAVVLMFGHEFLFGHFGLVTDAGLYLYNEFYRDRYRQQEKKDNSALLKTYIPARIGFQYYVKDAVQYHRHNFFAGIYIKSNMGQADFLEMGVGYTF